jgi:hypothetical protein
MRSFSGIKREGGQRLCGWGSQRRCPEEKKLIYLYEGHSGGKKCKVCSWNSPEVKSVSGSWEE